MSPPLARRRSRTFTTRKLTDEECSELNEWGFVDVDADGSIDIVTAEQSSTRGNIGERR